MHNQKEPTGPNQTGSLKNGSLKKEFTSFTSWSLQNCNNIHVFFCLKFFLCFFLITDFWYHLRYTAHHARGFVMFLVQLHTCDTQFQCTLVCVLWVKIVGQISMSKDMKLKKRILDTLDPWHCIKKKKKE